MREGEATTDRIAARQKSLLDRGHDWEIRVYLDRKLVLTSIMETNLRPVTVLVSKQSKTLVTLELTVPLEENCEEAYERKSLKYADLMEDCRAKGWSVWLFPVEVSCGGFPAQSVWKIGAQPGISGRACKTAVRRLGKFGTVILLDMAPRDDLCWKSESVE